MKVSRWVLALAMVAITAPIGFAQNDTSTGQEKGKSDVRTVTGCLTKGSSEGHYSFVADDGSTWTVTSNKVDLADKVNHTVELTGVVSNAMAHNMKEDSKDAAADAGAKKSNNERGRLKVTDAKDVSGSCHQ